MTKSSFEFGVYGLVCEIIRPFRYEDNINHWQEGRPLILENIAMHW
jgi:hypothetical protein